MADLLRNGREIERGDGRALKIRLAAAADAAGLAQLANALAEALGGKGDAMTAENARALIEDEGLGLTAHVAEFGGDLVGYALHRPDYETSAGQKGRYVSDLYVAPSARRRGVAKALLSRAAAMAADEGGTYLWWVSLPENKNAARLYDDLADIRNPVTSYAATQGRFKALLDY